MNYEELAFFNQQLGAMLREGIPLEGALKQLSSGMSNGPLRRELEQLEADLSRGTPLNEALQRRDLPQFYKRMVEIGARSNDLPATLTLIADHYHRANSVWLRLKGLMVYPLIVIVVSLGLTSFAWVILSRFCTSFADVYMPMSRPPVAMGATWFPPIFMAILATLFIMGISLPQWRARLRWRLPAFREASLAQLASSLALMLRNGVPLPDALALAENLEAPSPAAAVLADWRARLSAGEGKPAHWKAPARVFPPLFLWLVQRSGEDLASGFNKAADIYQARAQYRTELVLYGALPISILLLGQMIVWQFMPLLSALTQLMNMLGG